MAAGKRDSQISTLLIDESFANQDDRFVEQVRSVRSSKYLAGLADRWRKDPRPWARSQILQYLALPLDRPGHHPLVKRLYKQAEENRDLELMAAFLVAFDRLVRRARRTRFHYDWRTRQTSQTEELYYPRDQIIPVTPRLARNPRTGEQISIPGVERIPANGRLFSYRTRGYLRRRVARYFRRIGFQKPADYTQSVAAALKLFTDDDFSSGENILDNWSLMQLAFRRSPALLFLRSRVAVAEGHSLSELQAAPPFEDLWKASESANVLLELLVQADSRLVRVWATQLLKRDHKSALQAITADQLLSLLNHFDDEVQQFGANLLETLTGLDSWPITTWLRLLETRSLTALTTITQVMQRRVNSARLTLEQCVAMASVRPTPVARLGLAWLAGRALTTDADRSVIGRLANVKCDAIGIEAAEFGLKIVGSVPFYSVDAVSPFFDSLNAQVRRGAWNWLTPDSPGYEDPALWSRLLETPYDDVRIRLIEELNQRTGQTHSHALCRQDVSTTWTSVLLAVHRGGRAKLTALRQISQAIANQPDRAERLVPVLAVAIRSVRPPEAKAGLSAILSAVAARPDLEPLLANWIPELRLMVPGATP